MLNPVAREALYSATYVENYLDCVENLPDDLQRHLTRMRELDVSYRACLRDVQNNVNNSLLPKDVSNSVQNNKRNKAISRIQQSLIVAQGLGDEKLQIVQLLQDLIDHKSGQLDLDYRNLVSCLDYGNGNSIKEEHMVVDPPSNLKDTSGNDSIQLQSSGNNGTGSRGGVGAGSGQGNISPTINHEREREKDRSERASKRARRARNDNASSNDINERSGNGREDGREGRGERERGQGDRERDREARDRSDSHMQSQMQHSQVEPPPRGGNSSSNKKNTTGKMGTGKKKKRKSRQTQSNQRDETPPPEDPDPIDPDEPTYCLCDQISFGEMILCDDDLCPVGWFHFSCVGLSTKPRGKWFCPGCGGGRPNIMKPKVQFLKELERYNKEKEEKA